MVLMTVRPTMPSDLLDLTLPWLVPDSDLDHGVSMVEEKEGQVVAAGIRWFTRTGASRDLVNLHCHDGYGSGLLSELASAADSPIMLRVIPGTPQEAAAQAAGGQVVQSVPAAFFDTAHQDVRDWTREQRELASRGNLSVRTGDEYDLDELLDLWMAPYLRMHDSWAPTQDAQAARESFRARFTQDLDKQRTMIVGLEAQPLAAVFTVGPFDGVLMPILTEVEPGHPASEAAARVAIASMLAAANPLPVEFDGHADEPTYMRILESIPQRASGKLTPMDLIEIR